MDVSLSSLVSHLRFCADFRGLIFFSNRAGRASAFPHPTSLLPQFVPAMEEANNTVSIGIARFMRDMCMTRPT